jgi:hypothetical protein
MYRHERVMRAAHRRLHRRHDRPHALIEHAKYFKAMPELW